MYQLIGPSWATVEKRTESSSRKGVATQRIANGAGRGNCSVDQIRDAGWRSDTSRGSLPAQQPQTLADLAEVIGTMADQGERIADGPLIPLFGGAGEGV